MPCQKSASRWSIKLLVLVGIIRCIRFVRSFIVIVLVPLDKPFANVYYPSLTRPPRWTKPVAKNVGELAWLDDRHVSKPRSACGSGCLAHKIWSAGRICGRFQYYCSLSVHDPQQEHTHAPIEAIGNGLKFGPSVSHFFTKTNHRQGHGLGVDEL
jgi:hypothetical protein